MKPQPQALAYPSATGLRRLLCSAHLLLLACALGWQWAWQRATAQQAEDAQRLATANHQRMLTQKITKLSLATLVTDDSQWRGRLLDEMSGVIQAWQQNSIALRFGGSLIIHDDRPLMRLYSRLNRHTWDLSRLNQDLQTAFVGPNSHASASAIIHNALRQEAEYLNILDAIARRYATDGIARRMLWQTVNRDIYVVVVLALLLEAVCLLYPTPIAGYLDRMRFSVRGALPCQAMRAKLTVHRPGH